MILNHAKIRLFKRKNYLGLGFVDFMVSNSTIKTHESNQGSQKKYLLVSIQKKRHASAGEVEFRMTKMKEKLCGQTSMSTIHSLFVRYREGESGSFSDFTFYVNGSIMVFYDLVSN